MARMVLIHQPELPIFLVSNEDDEIMVAPTQAWAEGQMEPPEVSTGYYVVLDAAGRHGHIRIDRWSVVIDGWDEERDIDGLCARISVYLDNRSLFVQPDLDATEYVRRAAQIISSQHRKVNWPKLPRWLNRLIHGM